jgi:gliding motility-associated lipoprotein GldH
LKKLVYIIIISSLFVACNKINVYEKRVTIPNHTWDKSFVPTFTFNNNAADKTNYLFAIVRHTNNYPYNNIYVKLTIKNAKDSSITKEINIPLTKSNANKEWANKGMDDIYEIKYPLAPFAGDAGKYTFTLENIMRDNPLPEILNIGLRLERKND